MATSLKIWTIISSGNEDIGQGSGSDPSISGCGGSIFKPEKLAISSLIVCGGPSRE